MSNYPEWWDSTITIYNKYEDKQTNVIKWYKTVLSKCFWKYEGEKVIVGNTVLETNGVTCRIPKSTKFKEHFEWEKLPNDEMENYFTISVGDIIVKGDVDDEISEYTKGQHSTDLITKYKDNQGCFVVESLLINVGPGRCNEHYHIKGV